MDGIIIFFVNLQKMDVVLFALTTSLVFCGCITLAANFIWGCTE